MPEMSPTETPGEAIEVQRRITQANRILGILSDGFWHSGLEFVQLSRPILSYTRRIHELREREGYVIEKERRNGIWKYRLVL